VAGEVAPIEIEIDFDTGEAQSSSQQFTAALTALQTNTGSLTRAVAAMEASTRRSTTATREAATANQAAATTAAQAATAAINFTQRLQGAASALQAVATAAGSSSTGAGAVARIAATTAQFAQMGAMLGPGGAVLGGIAGFVAGIRGMRQEQEAATTAAAEHAAALRDTADAAAEAVRASGTHEARLTRAGSTAASARARREARERVARFESGEFSPEEAAQASEYYAEQQQRVDAGRRRSAPGSTGAEIFAGSETDYQSRIEAADTSAAAYEESQRRSSRHGASSREGAFEYDNDVQNDTDQNSAERSMTAYEQEQRHLEDVSAAMRTLREQRDADAEAAQFNAEAQAAYYTEQADGVRHLAEEEAAASEARKQQEEEEMERMQALSDQKKELYQQQIEGYQEVTGVLVNGLVRAAAAIADGSASAEEAFKGLLASFLQYISQRAALEAAAEFAQAIGSFASYQYAAGAQHLAAGVLWAGVAVATGVGGAALSRPSAPSAAAPARPPGGTGSGDSGGGGSVVINWNSPVVTQQTTDQLGRTVGEMVDSSRRRFSGDT
jgi:hypothetical protein